MLNTAWTLLRETVKEFLKDKCTRHGAALAFYTALSLSPLLLMVISIAGLIFGEEAARGEVSDQISQLTGEEGAKAIQTMLANTRKQSSGIVATIVGLGTLILGATGVFAQLQETLNIIWNVPEKNTTSGLLRMLRDRLLSFSVVCGMAFLLLVSLVFTAFITGLSGYINTILPGGMLWLRLANCVLSFLLTGAMFAMIFKVLPAVRPAWSDVWIGAGLTALLFLIGKSLIGIYLGTAAVGSTYGAAGSFVVLLVWIYYSTQILLFGAEFTQTYAKLHGTGLRDAAGNPLP